MSIGMTIRLVRAATHAVLKEASQHFVLGIQLCGITARPTLLVHYCSSRTTGETANSNKLWMADSKELNALAENLGPLLFKALRRSDVLG